MLNKTTLKNLIYTLIEIEKIKDEYTQIYEIIGAFDKIEALQNFIIDEFDIDRDIYWDCISQFAFDGYMYDENRYKLTTVDEVVDWYFNYIENTVYWAYSDTIGWHTCESKETAIEALIEALNYNVSEELPYNYNKLYRMACNAYGKPAHEQEGFDPDALIEIE